MAQISRKRSVQAVFRIVPALIMPALVCLAALALAGCAAPSIADAGKLASGPGHAAAEQPVMRRPGVLHLAHVTVDSASQNTSGTVTPTPPQPDTGPLTGLPSFCDVTLTETDPAGNPISI